MVRAARGPLAESRQGRTLVGALAADGPASAAAIAVGLLATFLLFTVVGIALVGVVTGPVAAVTGVLVASGRWTVSEQRELGSWHL